MREYRARKTGKPIYEPYTGPYLSPSYLITLDDFNDKYWRENESMESIARSLNGYGGELRRLVLKAGGKLKTKREAYDDRMADGVTRLYYYNERFFDTWTPESAWVLGLIASDGCLLKRGNSWQITMADLDCLQQAADCFGYKGPIFKSLHTKCYVLKVNSTIMVRRLMEIGLTPRKSLTIKYPDMPHEMNRHFIRGVFDGDGSIGIQKPRSANTNLYTARVTIVSGSSEFATAMHNKFISAGFVSHMMTIPAGQHGFKCKKAFCHPTYSVRVGGHSTAGLYRWFYEGVPDRLCLARKHDKYRTWYNEFAWVYANGRAKGGKGAINCNHANAPV